MIHQTEFDLSLTSLTFTRTGSALGQCTGRRNLWPSCILLPLNVNHRMRGNSSNLAICSSFYSFNATGEIDPVQHHSGGTSLSLSIVTRLSLSSVSTSFVSTPEGGGFLLPPCPSGKP